MAAKLLRRCVSCHCVADRAEFWRVVRVHQPPEIHQNQAVISSTTNRHQPALPLVQLDQGMGRSAYICRNAPCLQQAQKKNRLSKALRTAIPASIFTELTQRLEQNGQDKQIQTNKLEQMNDLIHHPDLSQDKIG